jgi:hypothetical protein
MKRNIIFTGIGMALICIGAMLGDNQNVIPCFVCIGLGIAVLLIPQAKESQKS